MKKANIIWLVLLLFVLALMSIMQNSCQTSSTSRWKQNARIDDFINLDIKKIIICTPDDNDIEKWTPLAPEISEPAKISKIVDALKKAKRIEMACSAEKMKIITTRGKFIMDFGRDDKVAYGNHFESEQLLQLLKENGLRLPELKEPVHLTYGEVSRLYGEPNKIIICKPDYNNVGQWISLLEISEPEKINKAVDALKNVRIFGLPKGGSIESTKVVKEDKRFVMNFNANDTMSVGNYSDAKDFLQLLKEYGLQLPVSLEIVLIFREKSRVIFLGDPSKFIEAKKRLDESLQRRLKEEKSKKTDANKPK